MSRLIQEFELDIVDDSLLGLSDFRLTEYENSDGSRGAMHYYATNEEGKSVHLPTDVVAESILASYHSGIPDEATEHNVPASTASPTSSKLFDQDAPENNSESNTNTNRPTNQNTESVFGEHEGPGSLAGTPLDFDTDGNPETGTKKLSIFERLNKYTSKLKTTSLMASTAIVGYIDQGKSSIREMSPKRKKTAKIIGGIAAAGALFTASYLVTKGISGTPNGSSSSLNEVNPAPSGGDRSSFIPTPNKPALSYDVPYVEAPEPTASDIGQNLMGDDSISNTINTMPKQNIAEFGDLNADAIKSSPDVMPWTNVVNAGAENPITSIESGLERYNEVYGRSFSLGDGGMFWEGNSVINPQELEQYNRLMQQLAEAAEELDELSDSLPATS